MNWKINRRRLLTGAGAILTLPMLESVMPKLARAAGNGDPRRFVSMYMPNGTYNVKGDAVWYPAVGPLTTTLPKVLSPFAANIADFSVLMHPTCKARQQAPAGAHVSGITTYLTQRVATNFNSAQCTVPGSSFDQMVADAAGKPNLVLSGGCNTGAPDGTPFNYAEYASYKNGAPNEPRRNPVTLFNDMFASVAPTTPGAPRAAMQRNKSILDGSTADLKELQAQLGKNDNVKLDSYLTGLRALETSLAKGGSGCTGGTVPSSTLNNSDTNGNLSSIYIARMQAFCDMIALGFSCDIIRSVSLVYDGETGERRSNPCPAGMLLTDISSSLHSGISHYGQNGPTGPDRATSRDRTYMSIFVYLINKLKTVSDPSGSPILDNTLILQGFGVEDGQHTGAAEGTPMVLGGGKNFAKPGNCIDLKNADMTSLFFTFSQYLNMGLPNFGGSSTMLPV